MLVVGMSEGTATVGNRLVLPETVTYFLKRLPRDLAIPLGGINPRGMKAGTQTGTCMPMLVAALFTVAKRGKYPKCP